MRVSCAVAALLLLSWQAAFAQRADTVKLRAANPCSRCISLTQVATLRLPDTLGGFVSPVSFARSSGGDYYVRDPFGQLGIHRFDAKGRYLQTIGRRGGGPGEYTFIESFHLDANDTLWIFGSNHGVFTANGRLVRSSRLDQLLRPKLSAGSRDGKMFVVGLSQSPDEFGVPLHIVRSDGSIERSFGARPGGAIGRSIWDRRQSLAPGLSSTFYTAFANSYAIEEWSTRGAPPRVFERDAEWFRPWVSWDGRSDVERPPARLAHMTVDASGLLWTVSIVPDLNWRAVTRRSSEQQRIESLADLERRFDTMVEVVDLSRAEVVASQRMPGIVVGAFGSNHLALTAEDSNGEVVATIWRASLTRAR